MACCKCCCSICVARNLSKKAFSTISFFDCLPEKNALKSPTPFFCAMELSRGAPLASALLLLSISTVGRRLCSRRLYFRATLIVSNTYREHARCIERATTCFVPIFDDESEDPCRLDDDESAANRSEISLPSCLVLNRVGKFPFSPNATPLCRRKMLFRLEIVCLSTSQTKTSSSSPRISMLLLAGSSCRPNKAGTGACSSACMLPGSIGKKAPCHVKGLNRVMTPITKDEAAMGLGCTTHTVFSANSAWIANAIDSPVTPTVSQISRAKVSSISNPLFCVPIIGLSYRMDSMRAFPPVMLTLLPG
mmetsp:Transcript_34579/g.56082  ORF Transcript_34579/g.56082 Transcript_34579/m.56082 type:complete len:306 (+) Transcript_34579:239-1156(+)